MFPMAEAPRLHSGCAAPDARSGLIRKAASSAQCPAITRSPRALRVYIDAVGIAEDCKGWLFRTARVHNGSVLSDKPMSQPDAWRAVAAGIATEMPDREIGELEHATGLPCKIRICETAFPG
jgi:hypothetical protein